MSDQTPTPRPPHKTQAERHLDAAAENGSDAAMHVQNAIRHGQDGNAMGQNIELTDAAVAVFRGQVELVRAEWARKESR